MVVAIHLVVVLNAAYYFDDEFFFLLLTFQSFVFLSDVFHVQFLLLMMVHQYYVCVHVSVLLLVDGIEIEGDVLGNQ